MWVNNDVDDFKNNTSTSTDGFSPPTYKENTMCGEDS